MTPLFELGVSRFIKTPPAAVWTAFEAMMTMKKIDIAALVTAADKIG